MCDGMPCVWREDEDDRRIDRARCHSYLPRRSRSGLAPATHRTRTCRRQGFGRQAVSSHRPNSNTRGKRHFNLCATAETYVLARCTAQLSTRASGTWPQLNEFHVQHTANRLAATFATPEPVPLPEPGSERTPFILPVRLHQPRVRLSRASAPPGAARYGSTR